MKNRKNFFIWSLGFLLTLGLALIPSVAQANAGVPMIFLVYPPLKIALVPIILIEAAVYWKLLNLSKKEAFLCSLCTNLISTLAGFPLLWLAIVTVGMIFFFINSFISLPGIIFFILFPVWLGPLPNEQLLYLIPLSSFLFIIIAYFVSVFIEKLFMKWLLEEVWQKQIDRSRLHKSLIYANLATYIPLAIFIPLFLYVRGLQYVS
ncbi:hypothetical protein ACE1B6_21705 [Aerosakkonemataceae cyanobacterium BLCC-F154]|uniref:Uncharacterized protein n=1 Tax=Floridaenema fluviatile BLCC-F154 TaxID=3153640 RepID=A0ABV4YIF2_9CYAN